MESQARTRQIGLAKKTPLVSVASDYPEETIVNLRLPRKRIASLDVDVDLAELPKRKPHIVLEIEAEGAE